MCLLDPHPAAHAAASTSDASAVRRQRLCGWQAPAHPRQRSAAPAIQLPATSPSCSGDAQAGSAASRIAAPEHAARWQSRNDRHARPATQLGLCCSFNKFRRHRIAGEPQLHGTVIDGIGHTKISVRGIGRVSVLPTFFKSQRGCASHSRDAKYARARVRVCRRCYRMEAVHASASSRSAIVWRRSSSNSSARYCWT